jgi:hypothetical protein
MKLRVLLYCLLGGVVMMLPGLSLGHLLWWFLSGAVLTASFVPVALFGPRRALGQFGVIFPVLLIIKVLTLWSEALIFIPSALTQEHPVRDLIAESVFYLVFALVLAILVWMLNLTRESAVEPLHRPLRKATAMIVICAVTYMIYYLVFGGITYQFFTKAYYPSAPSAVERLGLWFWAIQIGRGLLMTLAVVPAIYTLRMRRLHTAVSAGLLIWVAGGLAPLLVPNELMGSTQRFIHVVEIFTQNFTLGVTAALLLRPKVSQVAATPSAMAASL